MTDQLKACPFCNKKPKVVITGWVKCPQSGIGCHTRGMSKDDWQSRPLEDALQAELDTVYKNLQAAVEALFLRETPLRTSINAAVEEIRKQCIAQVNGIGYAGLYSAEQILCSHGLIPEKEE